jgi:hypothetical protein
MWVCLNDEGKRVWGDVFPDGKVPVCSMNFFDAKLDNDRLARVVMVNFAALSSAQKDAVLNKFVDVCGVPKGALQSRLRLRNEILKDIFSIGLPLRECYTTGVVAAELRFFI